MDIEQVKAKYDELNERLQYALSHMELSDEIHNIRQEMLELQNECPHGNFIYNYAMYEECPYCKKKFGA
jgi:hypothetical protein